MLRSARVLPLVALVLAVDISYSMDRDEQELQRESFAEAFRSPLINA
ncbi:DUF1194 domain-containing protein [Microvirga zambiensis]|nr:DUF1194 domain-containing protein [Microvirga zambiensis]